MIEVYHLNEENFLDLSEGTVVISQNDNNTKAMTLFIDSQIGIHKEKQTRAITQLFNEGYYDLVAEVKTSSLEKAFELTNHIDSSWIKNKGISSFVEDPRSSKVGDVMKDENGKYHIVASMGFFEIDDGLIKSHLQKNKLK